MTHHVLHVLVDVDRPAADELRQMRRCCVRRPFCQPPPIAVEVVAVDPKAKTITVRHVAAVPAAGVPIVLTDCARVMKIQSK